MKKAAKKQPSIAELKVILGRRMRMIDGEAWIPAKDIIEAFSVRAGGEK